MKTTPFEVEDYLLTAVAVKEYAHEMRAEIERLRDCLKWLLENDELTNYGQKTVREALEQ